MGMGTSSRRSRSRVNMEKQDSFDVAETSELFATLIFRHSRSSEGFITREELVKLFLDDPRGSYLVRQAIRKGNTGTEEWIAGNMLDHLSAHITDGTSAFRNMFLRKKIGKKWAYRGK